MKTNATSVTHTLFVAADAPLAGDGQRILRRACARRLRELVTVSRVTMEVLYEILPEAADTGARMVLETAVAAESSAILYESEPLEILKRLTAIEQQAAAAVVGRRRQKRRRATRAVAGLLASDLQVALGPFRARGPAWAVVAVSILAILYSVLGT